MPSTPCVGPLYRVSRAAVRRDSRRSRVRAVGATSMPSVPCSGTAISRQQGNGAAVSCQSGRDHQHAVGALQWDRDVVTAVRRDSRARQSLGAVTRSRGGRPQPQRGPGCASAPASPRSRSGADTGCPHMRVSAGFAPCFLNRCDQPWCVCAGTRTLPSQRHYRDGHMMPDAEVSCGASVNPMEVPAMCLRRHGIGDRVLRRGRQQHGHDGQLIEKYIFSV